MEQAHRTRARHGLRQLTVGQRAFSVFPADKAGPADFQGPKGLLERLFERTPDGHRLADRLHLGRQGVAGPRELLESEARRLDDDVVQRRLEASRRRAGDVVGQLVEGIAHRQLGRDFGDRKARRFRGQGRTAADARIHFNDHEPAVAGIHGELHVGAAGFDADRPHHRQARVAQRLVFAVRQRQRRRHRQAVARVHAHRIEVFNGTDDAGIILAVAHHFHLEFFPAQHGFFDQHFADRTEGQAVGADGFELLFVAGDAAAGPAKGEARPHDHRPRADLRLHGPSLVQTVGRSRPGHGQPDACHGLLEQPPVLGAVDHLRRRPDQFHLVALQDSPLMQLHRQVQRRLPAHRRQQRIRPLAPDDRRQRVLGQRLDVRSVGKARIGHDRRGIAVDQHHLVAFFPQRLAGLRSRIIEFARLADHNRPGAHQQDFG